MNKYQIAKLNTYELAVRVARNDETTTRSISSFSKGIDRLEAITITLGKIKIEQEKDITGITDDKGDVQEQLCDYLLDIAGAIHSYAHAKKDLILMAKVDYKPNSVEKMLQADIITACETIEQEADKIPATDLLDEGIDSKDLEKFSDLLVEYKKIKPAPRGAIIERSTNTVNIKDLFSEANNLIKNSLNRLATQFKRKNPAYYLKYKAALNIVYPKPNNKPEDTKTKLV